MSFQEIEKYGNDYLPNLFNLKLTITSYSSVLETGLSRIGTETQEQTFNTFIMDYFEGFIELHCTDYVKSFVEGLCLG